MQPTDASIPQPQLQIARRIFVWTVGIALLALWWAAIYQHQAQWPIASVMALLIFVYVCAASAENVVSIVQNAGVLKAVAAASNAATSVADVIGDAANAAGGMITKTTTTTAPVAATPKVGDNDD